MTKNSKLSQDCKILCKKKTGMHWEFMHTKQWRTPIFTDTMHQGDCWPKWTKKSPTHHERLMVCGQETLFCCVPVLQLTTVVSYVLTYVVTTRCLTYLLNYLSNQLYSLPTYIWYSPLLEPFSQNCYLASFWNLLLQGCVSDCGSIWKLSL